MARAPFSIPPRTCHNGPATLYTLVPLVLLLLPCTLVAVPTFHTLPAVQPLATATASKGYLLPLLRGFANNQIVGLKEVLALGQLLGRTVVLTDIIESTHEQRPGFRPRVIPFEDVFAREGIEALQPVISLRQLQQQGWSGDVGLVLMFKGKGSSDLWLHTWEAAFNITTVSSARRFQVGGFKCQEEAWVDLLRKKVEGVPVVGVSTFEGVVGEHPRQPGREWRFADSQGQLPSPCHTAYMKVTQVLHKSEKIQQLAQLFIQQALGGGPFVALHVRPYPDACLMLWKHDVIDQSKADRPTKCCRVASGQRLYEVLGPAMSKVVGARRLFVMSDPTIRHQINRLLAAHGIQPLYMSLDYVLGMALGGADPRLHALHGAAAAAVQRGGGGGARAALVAAGAGRGEAPGAAAGGRRVLEEEPELPDESGGEVLGREEEGDGAAFGAAPVGGALGAQGDGEAQAAAVTQALSFMAGAVSLLGMVEAEVARRSAVFFATTGHSSMAGMIIQEREVQGAASDTSITFDQLGSLDPLSWPEPWASPAQNLRPS